MLTGKQIACSSATYFCQTLNENSLASNVISLVLDGNLLKHRGLNTLIRDYFVNTGCSKPQRSGPI